MTIIESPIKVADKIKHTIAVSEHAGNADLSQNMSSTT